VYEEAQVRLASIRYVSSQPWPFPASAMCGFYAEAQNRKAGISDELAEVRWFTTRELTDAVNSGEVLLSPPVSIAFQLLASWFAECGGGDLSAISRDARRRLAAAQAG
jgi:NAD+ diphosphatase